MEPTIQGYEIHPITETPLGYRKARDPAEASFWSLYAVLDSGDMVAIGDYESEIDAIEARTLLER